MILSPHFSLSWPFMHSRTVEGPRRGKKQNGTPSILVSFQQQFLLSRQPVCPLHVYGWVSCFCLFVVRHCDCFFFSKGWVRVAHIVVQFYSRWSVPLEMVTLWEHPVCVNGIKCSQPRYTLTECFPYMVLVNDVFTLAPTIKDH